MADIFPCLPAVTCPGSDSPILNYSSEAPDPDVFIGMDWGPPDSIQPIGDPSQIWNTQGCASTCSSSVSQEDADLCAQAQAVLCAIDSNPLQPGVFPVCNQQTGAVVNCPDGLPFEYTVPAGTYCGLSQSLVNQEAFSLAEVLVRRNEFCLSSLSPTNGCVGSMFASTVTATGTVVTPCTWQVISGSLPPGLTLGGFSPNIDTTLGPSETIQGTPTSSGSYSFTLQCTLGNGNFFQKGYTICISGITPATLPSGQVGLAYSATLTQFACAMGASTFSISSGALPPGLTLSSAGVISGTPSGTGGTYNFTVSASDTESPPVTCHLSSSITITNPVCNYSTTSPDPIHCPALYSYWLSNGGNVAWNGAYANEGIGPPQFSWSSPQFGASATDINFHSDTGASDIFFSILGGPSMTYTKAASVFQQNCYLGTYTLATWNGIGTTPPATVQVTL